MSNFEDLYTNLYCFLDLETWGFLPGQGVLQMAYTFAWLNLDDGAPKFQELGSTNQYIVDDWDEPRSKGAESMHKSSGLYQTWQAGKKVPMSLAIKKLEMDAAHYAVRYGDKPVLAGQGIPFDLLFLRELDKGVLSAFYRGGSRLLDISSWRALHLATHKEDARFDRPPVPHTADGDVSNTIEHANRILKALYDDAQNRSTPT